MNPTVSMVVPCYNKVKYIEAFFESVYAQKWDNIELILVNNGSTDGTQDILTEWASRFIERGFTVIRIDITENQGLPAAVKSGMLRATGEYFCTVDCDDELDPEYVSKMAGFLEEHPEYDWVACDFVTYSDTENGRVYANTEKKIKRRIRENAYFAERFLMGEISALLTAWLQMVRMRYLKACKVEDSFYVHAMGTQEAQYLIPLASGGGKLKCLPDKLYKYNHYIGQMSYLSTYKSLHEYHLRYFLASEQTIKGMQHAEKQKQRLLFIEKLHMLKRIYTGAITLGTDKELAEAANELKNFLNESFSPSPGITTEQLTRPTSAMLFAGIRRSLLNLSTLEYKKVGRLIACGVLGKLGREFLPSLTGTVTEPDVLWDSGARSDSEIYGRKVVMPDYDSLSPNDTVLIFPLIENVVNEIKSECSQRGVTSFIDYYDMLDILSTHYFPQFLSICEFKPADSGSTGT